MNETQNQLSPSEREELKFAVLYPGYVVAAIWFVVGVFAYNVACGTAAPPPECEAARDRLLWIHTVLLLAGSGALAYLGYRLVRPVVAWLMIPWAFACSFVIFQLYEGLQ